MGGFGSGRYGGKKKAEHCRTLDINKILKSGALRPGYHGGWQWSENGNVVANINFSSTDNLVTFKYRVRTNGDEWESVEQPTPIVWTNCRYGGQRPYFQCPGVVSGNRCHHRAIKLFSGGKYFLCRHCYNLAYNSQSETRHDRLLRRANKRRMALGGEPGICAWIKRPKGMWKRTHDRHKAEILSAESKATAEFVRMFSGRLNKEEMEMYLD